MVKYSFVDSLPQFFTHFLIKDTLFREFFCKLLRNIYAEMAQCQSVVTGLSPACITGVIFFAFFRRAKESVACGHRRISGHRFFSSEKLLFGWREATNGNMSVSAGQGGQRKASEEREIEGLECRIDCHALSHSAQRSHL